jgi:hypothetical protein
MDPHQPAGESRPWRCRDQRFEPPATLRNPPGACNLHAKSIRFLLLSSLGRTGQQQGTVCAVGAGKINNQQE